MSMSEVMILDRLRFVAHMPGRQDLADAVESMLASSKVYNPRKCLLTACSTEAEEEARWRFMHGIQGCAGRSITAAQNVVGKHLEKGFGIKADWSAIHQARRQEAA